MAKKDERTPLKKGEAKFMLIGEVKINDFTFNIDEESQSSDWIYNRLNLGVDCGNGNVVYSEMMGGYGAERDNVLYVHGIKEDDNGKKQDDWDQRFTIDWDDRFDEDILETVGNQCFINVGIEKDKKGKTFTKKFLSAYDAIEYIQEHLEDGTVVNVKGNLKFSLYNDEVQIKKEITSIYLSNVDNPEKYKAIFTQTILIDKDSVGKLDKEKASYPIYARVIDYTKMYNDKEVKTSIPFNVNFELEVNKENPEATKKFLNMVFKVKKDITEVAVEGELLEGASLVNITEDDLPDEIKDLIEIGVYTKEDAINKLAAGNRSREQRMVIRKPVIKMVGEEDNKSPVILKTEKKYTEEDLILDFMLENNEDDEDTDVADTETEETSEEDDNAWLKALGEDGDED